MTREKKMPEMTLTPNRNERVDLLNQLQEIEKNGIQLDQYQQGVHDALLWVLGKGEQPECLN